MSQKQTRSRVAAIEGWFRSEGPEPCLLGTRCSECGSYFFPKETSYCRNPACASESLEEVPLSTRGKLWSFTDNRYRPPEPYMSPDSFEPYAVAAVELEKERMVILGQVEGAAIEDLEAGMEMELVFSPLFADEEHEYIVWKWKPAA